MVGYGEDTSTAVEDHDRNLYAFLIRCKEKNLILNNEKLQLREAKVPFIGHIASDQGLLVDPEKTRAIAEMTVPTDKAAVHRLLGMVQCFSKLLPHLSDLTKPLRDLLQKDVEWW